MSRRIIVNLTRAKYCHRDVISMPVTALINSNSHSTVEVLQPLVAFSTATGSYTSSREDYTDTTSREHRRLDTIARFLELFQVCSAVTYIDGKLYISSNKLAFNGDESQREPKELRESISILRSVASGEASDDFLFNRLVAPAFKKSNKKYIEGVFVEEEDTFSMALNDWSKKLGIDKVFDSLVLLRNPYSPKINNTYKLALEIIIRYLNKDGLYKLTFEDPYTMDALIILARNMESIYKRATQDVRKLKALMKSPTDDLKPLREAILDESSIKLIFPSYPKTGRKDHHAEMNLMKYIIDNKLAREVYIGISKLSCAGCDIDVRFVNETKDSVKVIIRGAHGVLFESRMNTEWTKDAIKKFGYPVGISRGMNSSPLFSDLSDSDTDEGNVTILGYGHQE